MSGSIGSKWEYPYPTDWEDQIKEENKLQLHFENWQRGKQDKQGHCFWFVGGGPGSGKSRFLDEFPKVLQNAAAGIENCAELRED